MKRIWSVMAEQQRAKRITPNGAAGRDQLLLFDL
jgi:hypothetical protein